MGTHDDRDDVGRVAACRRHRFETLDDGDVPQRMGEIHRLAQQTVHERSESDRPTRSGQFHVPEVPGDVEVGVVHPHRCGQIRQHRRDALAESGQAVESGFRVGPQHLDAEPSPAVT